MDWEALCGKDVTAPHAASQWTVSLLLGQISVGESLPFSFSHPKTGLCEQVSSSSEGKGNHNSEPQKSILDNICGATGPERGPCPLHVWNGYRGSRVTRIKRWALSKLLSSTLQRPGNRSTASKSCKEGQRDEGWGGRRECGDPVVTNSEPPFHHTPG